MDSSIEIVEHDILEDSEIADTFTGFSQVKIEVHGGHVAEQIIEDLEKHTEEHQDYDEEFQEYTHAEAEEATKEIPEDTGNNPEEPQENAEDTPTVHLEGHTDHGPYLESSLKDPEPQHFPPEYTNYLSIQIKQEIEQSDGTDYTDFDEASAEAYQYDRPPEDIYHFNNKIILGSKPCQSTSETSLRNKTAELEDDTRNLEEICIQKEYLEAVVMLEDWSLHLKDSPSFCKKCDTLFATPSCLALHNMTMHSLLVPVSKNVAKKSTARPAYARKSTGAVVKRYRNSARKSTGNNSMQSFKYCHHCNTVFRDHTALIKHLYELIPLKQFKCNACEAVFNNQNDLIDHNVVHVKTEKPKIKKKKAIKEVIPKLNVKKKLLYEEDIKKKHPVSLKKEGNIIPISALFQCPLCNIHFLTAFAGLQHWLICKTGLNTKKHAVCKTCKHKLRGIDIKTHKKQHEVCTKFKVYKITQNIFERTLCKCLKCGVHFNDLTVKAHLKNCGKIPTVHCLKCNILIPRSKIDWHSKKHSKYNLKPKDFIIVQFVLNKAVKSALEPKLPPAKKIKLQFPSSNTKKETQIHDKNSLKKTPSQNQEKPLKPMNVSIEQKEVGKRIKMVNRLKFEKGNKVRMYFCKNCNGCCRNDSNRAIHSSKQCQHRSKVNDRVICPECGLQFNRKTIVSHENMHKKRSFTIHDIVFYHIGTLKPTVPSMPAYPQCKNCKITFFSSAVQSKHICGEDYKSCNKCGEKFHNSAYSIHMEFHKLIKTPQGKKTEAKMIPMLMQKYESLNMTWDIIYFCLKCDIVTDLYDKAIEHSQAHLNQEASSKNIKCYICNLKFDETCWSKHSDLHSRMMINSKDFKILSYNPQKLLTEEWFQLFDSIPEQQIRQITDKSLYGYERGVKMKLVKDGRAEFTLYCCCFCNVCCPNNEIVKHIKSVCSGPANLCKICNIPFSDVNALKCHKMLHSNGVKKDEFRVVSFAKNTNVKVNKLTLQYKNSTAKFELYKCNVCGTCLQHRHNIARHNCIPEPRKAKCNKCNEVFNRTSLVRHKEEHRIHPDFNFKNLKVHLFDPSNKHNEDDVEDEENNDDDDNEEDDAFEPVKKKYKRLKPANPTKEGKTKAIPSSKTCKDATSKTTSEQTKTAKVYKCDCGLHYTSMKTIECHLQKCCPDWEISIENCSKCGLLFPTDVLVNHLCKHHSNNTKIVVEAYKKSDNPEESFESVESTSENSVQNVKRNTPAKEPKSFLQSNVKIYKCSECNVYFLVQSTCYKHVYKGHEPIEPKNYIECKLCGLQFTLKNLPLHISRHHKNEFKLDNVLVEEYHPPVGKGPPRIELYIAAERAQSLQVTSSIEESRISSS